KKINYHLARIFHADSANNGEISQESISKIELIECWLLHYAAACKGETSKQAINQRSPEFY
ncbi:9663_t:CDS:1, partial [Entrophospora sp. SA101]